MDSKYLTATIIGGLFVALAYSSSAQVFAADNSYIMSCSYTKDKKTSFCSDNDPSNNDVWRCDKQKNGTWKCGKIPRESGGSLPTDLKKALNLATESAVNVTSMSPDFLSKKKELLNNDNEITSEESNNSSLQ
ncbi:MAG: hypothetical protein M3O68_03050 [Thermoproteota archaeon]|nr:hypothetical protein [Thermoproteota archaeon]